MFKEIRYPSNDNITEIHACMWIPVGKINAILQIEHGMTSYIKRYESIAEILNNAGILVCGSDHLGHGESVIDREHYGYFASVRGDKILIEDAIKLTDLVKAEYPNIPYYILGHSFGSFLVRNYITKYDNEVNGAIIMGSAYHSPLKMDLAILYTAIHQFYHHGWFYRSASLKKMTIGNMHKYFEDNDPNCWLTRNKEVLKSYANDPMCDISFTCNGYLNMFRLIKNANKKSALKNINKDLPLFIVSGGDDPVGNFGKRVERIYKFYKAAKMNNVKLKIYNNMRHEILSEPERIIVVNDLIAFINSNNLKAKK